MNRILSAIQLGFEIDRTLPGDIEKISETGWGSNDADRVITGVRDYARHVLRLSAFLSLVSLAPLFGMLLWANPKIPHPYLYPVYSTVVLFVSLVAISFLWPIISITRWAPSFPEAFRREFSRSLFLSIDMLCVAIHGGLLLYVYWRWQLNGIIPFMIVFFVLWVCAPWAAFVIKGSLVLLKIRIAQFVPLLAITLLTLAFPNSILHIQWWAKQEAASHLRTNDLSEVTGQWQTLEWFNREGDSLIWFSGNAAQGYKLFSAPGYDSQTNEELKPVTDRQTKDKILDAFAELKRSHDREADNAALELRKEAAAALVEKRKSAVRDYMFSSTNADIAAKNIPVVIAVNDELKEEEQSSELLSKAFNAAGLQTRSTVFTPAYVSSSHFTDLLNGRKKEQTLFPVEDYATRLLVIRITTQFSKPTTGEFADALFSNLRLRVQLINTADGKTIYVSNIEARGVGFSENAARDNAFERLNKSLPKLADTLKEI